MSERIPNQERIEKTAVIESLLENSGDLSILNRFLDQREAEVQNSRDTLALNIEVAEIYRDAGLVEHAIESFREAANQAMQEREDELCFKLLEEARKLD